MILLFLAFVFTPLLPKPPDDPNRSRSLLDDVWPFLSAACAALTDDGVNTADASKLRPTRAPYYVCNGFCSNTFDADDSRVPAFLELLSMYVKPAFFLAEEIDCLYVSWIRALSRTHSPHPLRRFTTTATSPLVHVPSGSKSRRQLTPCQQRPLPYMCQPAHGEATRPFTTWTASNVPFACDLPWWPNKTSLSI